MPLVAEPLEHKVLHCLYQGFESGLVPAELGPTMHMLPRLVSATASALFLLLLPFRVSKLRTETVKVVPEHHGQRKLVSSPWAETLFVCRLNFEVDSRGHAIVYPVNRSGHTSIADNTIRH